jgi:DhnA family fructose-bisphosphate aldolase class Ia
MKAGCIGLAIGRNVWQAEDPMKITKELKKVFLENKKTDCCDKF